jgi:hypothetical protein
MIKAPKKLGLEGIFCNIIKAIYDKPILNIKINGKQMRPFPVKSGTKQGCPLFPLLCNMVFEFLARAIR